MRFEIESIARLYARDILSFSFVYGHKIIFSSLRSRSVRKTLILGSSFSHRFRRFMIHRSRRNVCGQGILTKTVHLICMCVCCFPCTPIIVLNTHDLNNSPISPRLRFCRCHFAARRFCRRDIRYRTISPRRAYTVKNRKL